MRATLILLVLPILAVAGPKPGAEGTPEYQAATDLVRKLGDPRFSVREAAGKKLVEMGAAAVPALAAGTKSADEEVRTRSTALLPQAEAVGWARRADAFLADPDGKHDLPLSAEWNKLTGKPDAGSRRLYADMLRHAGPLLETAAADRTAGLAAVAARAKVLLDTNRAKGAQVEVPAGAVAAVLFVQAMLQAPPRPAGRERTEPLYLLANPATAAALGDKEVGPAFRRLVVGWIESRPDQEHMSGLYFALLAHRRPFPEADPVLIRLATKHPSVQVRWVATGALGRSGTETATARLTELLTDTTTMYDNLGNADAGHQVRDCALAALVGGKGKDPAAYGMDYFMSANFWFGGTEDKIQVHLWGFRTKADREKGFAKWRAEGKK